MDASIPVDAAVSCRKARADRIKALNYRTTHTPLRNSHSDKNQPANSKMRRILYNIRPDYKPLNSPCMKLLLRTGVISLLFLLPLLSGAQLRLFSASGDVGEATRKVLQDYPNHFSHITGALIVRNPQSADYECTVTIKEAESNIITRYTSDSKQVCSWQAVLLSTESFSEAKRRFKTVYSQLNGLPVNSSKLKGEYRSPEEEMKFTTVVFSLVPVDEPTRNLKTELVMESEGMEWKVRVLVYEREREDDESGHKPEE